MSDPEDQAVRPGTSRLVSSVGGYVPSVRLGRFTDPRLEDEYRASRFEHDRHLSRRVLLLVATGSLLLGINDYRFAETSGLFWGLLSLRLAVSLALVGIWLALKRLSRVAALDHLVTTAFLLLILMYGVVQHTRPPGLPGAVLISLGITFTVYLTTLLPAVNQVAIGTAVAVVALASQSVSREPESLLTFAVAILTANLTGMTVSAYQQSGQRLQFATLRRANLLGCYFEDLIDVSPNVIYVTDADGEVLVANRQTHLVGIQPVADPDVVLTGRHVERDERVVGPDGTSRWFHTVQVPFPRPDGRLHVVGISTDITERINADEERRLLEAKVQHAQKLESLGVLAGGIAHDFNNLLAVIMGNASYAGIVTAQNPEASNAIREIDQAAQRAADLVEQMLAYAGQGHFAIGPLDLSTVVREMSALLRPVIGRQACRFELDDAWVTGDVSQIRQIVMNLMTNAADAVEPTGGTVTLRTGMRRVAAAHLADAVVSEGFAPGIVAALEVSDTGIGMEPETLSRIFDPFFTTKFTGRGLGLAAVIGIVRRHRGALKVVSAPGKGTTFTVWLPLTSASSPRGAVADTPDEVLQEVAEAMARRHARSQRGTPVPTTHRAD